MFVFGFIVIVNTNKQTKGRDWSLQTSIKFRSVTEVPIVLGFGKDKGTKMREIV